MKLLTPRMTKVERATETSNSWTRRREHWNGIKAALKAAEDAKVALIRPLDLVGGRDKPYLPPLPGNLRTAVIAPKGIEEISSTFHWRPCQVREHDQPMDDPGHTLGTHVNTLCYNLSIGEMQGMKPMGLRIEPGNFASKGTAWVHTLSGGFVICRGIVIGRCPKVHEPEQGRNARVARLPAEARPKRPLSFAALLREAFDVRGHMTFASHLVTLYVMPDGWIYGRSLHEKEGAIDLSAIRFCISGGLSLIDEVSLHTVDTANTRLVCLQGTLSKRYHTVHGVKSFAMIPESCRPPTELPFITTGSSSGSYNLIALKPLTTGGLGGELHWKDGIWSGDEVSVSGIFYEVSADAMPHSLVNANWSPELLGAFMGAFQKFLNNKFGSLEDAWEMAFDAENTGEINFTQFASACKKAGYVGNATRLWAALDEENRGTISLEELSKDFLEECNAAAAQHAVEGNALSLTGLLKSFIEPDDFALPGVPDEQ